MAESMADHDQRPHLRDGRVLWDTAGHDSPVLVAIVTIRTGGGNAPCWIFLSDFREVLSEMPGMVVHDPSASLERIVLEFRVMSVEAVELHHVARPAFLVGDLVEIIADALMLLVAGRAR